MADRDDHETPTWVKVFGGILIVLIAAVVVGHFILGLEHGPGLHGL